MRLATHPASLDQRVEHTGHGGATHYQPVADVVRFYEELGPISRGAHPDRQAIAALFEKHDMALLGPPLSPD